MPVKRKSVANDKGHKHVEMEELIEGFESDDDLVTENGHPFLIYDPLDLNVLGSPASFHQGGLFSWSAVGDVSPAPGRDNDVSANMGKFITLHLRGAPLDDRRTAIRRLWEGSYNMQACKQLAIFFCDLKKLPSGVESKKAYIDLLIERNVPFVPYDEFDHMVREATRKQRSPGFKALNWSVYYARFTTDYVFGKKKVDAKANNDSLRDSRRKLAEVLQGVDDNSDEWALPTAASTSEPKASASSADQNEYKSQLIASVQELKAKLAALENHAARAAVIESAVTGPSSPAANTAPPKSAGTIASSSAPSRVLDPTRTPTTTQVHSTHMTRT